MAEAPYGRERRCSTDQSTLHLLASDQEHAQSNGVRERRTPLTYVRPPQQRRMKAPKHAGMQSFDLKNGLREQPVQKRKCQPVELPSSASQHQNSPNCIDDPNTDTDEHHARVWNGILEIERQSKRSRGDRLQSFQDSSSIYPVEPARAPEHKYNRSHYEHALDGNYVKHESGWYNSHTKSRDDGMPGPSSRPGSYEVDPATSMGKTLSPTSPNTTAQLSPDRLFKQPETRPISEEELIREVKGIYAGLVMVEKKCNAIVTQPAACNQCLGTQQWKALVALHRTLLQEHHDFFSATQHPVASPALRSLATKYAIPQRLWRQNIRVLKDAIRHRFADDEMTLLSLLSTSSDWLTALKRNVPSMMNDWNMLEANLQEYLQVLRADGIKIPEEFIQTKYNSAYNAQRPPSPPVMDTDFNEVLRSHFYQQQNANPPFTPDEAEQWYSSIALPLKDTVKIFISGWLTYGQKIAKDFHYYCKMFKFLAWAGIAL